MNIFVTSECPHACAEYLDDKRVVKMVLETAQILSTVIYKYDPEYHQEAGLYKPTHQGHPCVVWAAESLANYTWLFEHFNALCEEYYNRYNKQHKSSELGWAFDNYFWEQDTGGEDIPEPSYFVNCARNKELGIDYTNVKNICVAYQLYLNDRWDTDKRTPTWYKEGR